MSQKTYVIGLVLIAMFCFAGNAATQEYSRIKSRLEATQAKVDKLTDELRETTKTIHAAIKSLTERFARQTEAKPIEVVETKQVEPIKTVQPTIIMHSADEEKGVFCGPCRAWLKTEKAKWEQIGWSVEVIKEVETKRGWPWYEITDRDVRFEVQGSLTTEKFLAAKKAR
jgi:outer membrane murein-binding lipoprotein Lpp